jgi:hypothetical protein
MDYHSSTKTPSTNSPPLSDSLLIAPFNTIGDFMFMQNAIWNNLMNNEIDGFLDVHRLSTESPVTFKNHRDVRKALNQASAHLTEVCPYNFDDGRPCLVLL